MGWRRWRKSVNFALRGIGYGWSTQPNLRIHGVIALLVLLLGAVLKLRTWEWVALFFAIAFVIVAEMVNTAIECTVDLVTREYHPLAKNAKNIAAGAVLITAANAVLVGLLVLGPHLWKLIVSG